MSFWQKQVPFSQRAIGSQKKLRMRFIDRKTDGSAVRGKIAFYCDALDVARRGFYWHLKHRDDPWKYRCIAEKIRGIMTEDEYNDTYGRCQMYQTLNLKFPDKDIPS